MENNNKITKEKFDSILIEVIDDSNQKPSNLLSIPGIYEILSEYYNNDVIFWFEY
jgi:hypothetical protein